MDNLKSRSDTKRDQILKVASQLFMENGFNAVTMEAIAEAAPVSKPTLYNHFENKQALFFAVMEVRADNLFLAIENEMRSDQSIEETLTRIGHSFLDVVLRPEGIRMFRLMIAESGQFPELGKIFYESGPRKIAALISSYLKKEHDAGRLTVPNPDLSANFYLNMIKGNAHMQCLMALKEKIPPKDRAEVIDYAVSIFLKGHGPNAE
jgi:TetR/AcrR family transcriptional repressor of mexJK operon